MTGRRLTDNKIIVLDFGGQGNYLVARRVRALKVYAEIYSGQTSLQRILKAKPLGVILVGQPPSFDESREKLVQDLLKTKLPVLALGEWPIRVVGDEHHEQICKLRGLPNDDSRAECTEFQSFIYEMCQAEPTWTMNAFADHCISEIKAKVQDAPVICGLSGGVDSTVAAALVQKAVGSQLHTIFVDNGLMRKNEVREVKENFAPLFGENFRTVDAGERFLKLLQGVIDPEEKRKIIGHEFIRTFEREARRVGSSKYLVQGTVYPDVVESGQEEGALVKSHHNVGGLPDDMELGLIEPLRWLFKEEVREVGELLGLPKHLVWRQPFPGPGLAVRIIGEVNESRLAILRDADFILRDGVREAGLAEKIWQYFAVLTDVRTVGVQESKRAYGYTVGIRAVNSRDGMVADWAKIPFDVLERISHRIMAEVQGVNRVVYDISSKPPATIEWE